MKEEKKSKVHKAAKILLALGQEGAAAVIKHLDDSAMEKVMAELLQMGPLDEKERKELLAEFEDEVKTFSSTMWGGKDQAEKMLLATLGERKARPFLDRLERNLPDLDFNFFEQYSPLTLARVLGQELEQTTGLILTHLKPQLSAKVLKELPAEYAARVAKKIAEMQKVLPETLEAIYNSLKTKLEKMRHDEFEDTSSEAGEERLSKILNQMDLKSEEDILDALGEKEPDMAARIKSNLFTFENLNTLTQQEVRKIFEILPEEECWATALKGSGRDFMRYIFSCISVNRATDIARTMEDLGPITLTRVEEERQRILNVAEELNRRGDVILRKHKERFIE